MQQCLAAPTNTLPRVEGALVSADQQEMLKCTTVPSRSPPPNGIHFRATIGHQWLQHSQAQLKTDVKASHPHTRPSKLAPQPSTQPRLSALWDAQVKVPCAWSTAFRG